MINTTGQSLMCTWCIQSIDYVLFNIKGAILGKINMEYLVEESSHHRSQAVTTTLRTVAPIMYIGEPTKSHNFMLINKIGTRVCCP